MNNHTFIKEIDKYFKNTKHTGVIHDDKLGYIITDSYSMIRLNNNNLKDKSKIDDIIEIYGKNETDKLCIIKYLNDNNNNNYCNHVDLHECKKEPSDWDKRIELVEINGRLFDLSKIRRIGKILGVTDISKLGIFTSNNDDKFISITSKNGYAYLLGCYDFKKAR